jgi:hypothetical protein
MQWLSVISPATWRAERIRDAIWWGRALDDVDEIWPLL